MSFTAHVKNVIKTNPLLRKAVYRPLRYTLEHTVYAKAMAKEREQWRVRTAEVCGCPDNDHIPRVPGAGSISDGVQIMHNGQKIRVGSYYGSAVTNMLRVNTGVHEPQEEWVFQEVIKAARPDGVMLELGAYWGFYSMWFLSGSAKRRAILVEPEPENLKMGQDNFALNGLRGEFVQAFVGDAPSIDQYGRRTVCVDELAEQYKLDRIDILHADIQGFEVHMLRGAKRCLERRMIDYVFISTHGQELHDTCRTALREAGFEIIADADMADTYSFDGLIAARRSDVVGVAPVPISRKTAHGVRR